jgi:hypothetical protein
VDTDDEHLLVVGSVEDPDPAARRQALLIAAQVVLVELAADGTLKLSTLTPCGLTPLIT